MGCASSSLGRRIRDRYEKVFARRVPDANGGGMSLDGRYLYGYASTQANSTKMEDYFEDHIDEINQTVYGFFAVYDGHNGKRVAQYLRDNLCTNITSRPDFVNETARVLEQEFIRADEDLLNLLEEREEGSTASVAVLFSDRFFVAHVGVSKIVISRNRFAIQLTRDHLPDDPAEQVRIQDSGGMVLYAGGFKVGGLLAVSRAFGNPHLKRSVPADPDVRDEPVNESLECIIIGSEGLWKTITNQEAVDIVMQENNVQEAANRLMEEALARDDHDNITCIVVKFNH